MSQNNRINYIEFPVKELEPIKSFYTDVFGWTFTDYGDAYSAFSDGALNGGFYKADIASSAQDGAALVVLYADELEDAMARVEHHGGKVVKDIFDFPGGRRFHFQDPSGNELSVWSDK